MSSELIGKKAEDIAALYLESKGYRVIEKRFWTRGGEIDLVAKDEEALVFVEVKYRSGRSFGGPEEFVTKEKQRKIRIAAMHYVAGTKTEDVPIRFDVVALWREEGRLKAHLYRNAFEGE